MQISYWTVFCKNTFLGPHFQTLCKKSISRRLPTLLTTFAGFFFALTWLKACPRVTADGVRANERHTCCAENQNPSFTTREKEGLEFGDNTNYLPCSSCRVLVGWSQTSLGPKYWIGPGYTYDVSMAHFSRLAANFLNGAPFNSTKALRITGFISP